VHEVERPAGAVPHLPVDVERIGCDFLAFSGHKMLGPTGVGVLFIRRAQAEALLPAISGGGTIDTEAECRCPSLEECGVDYVTFQPLPYKWQAGTPPIAEAIGLQAAIEYLGRIGIDNVAAHDRALVALARERLGAIPGVRLFGPADPALSSSIVSFNVGDVTPHEVGRILDERSASPCGRATTVPCRTSRAPTRSPRRPATCAPASTSTTRPPRSTGWPRPSSRSPPSWLRTSGAATTARRPPCPSAARAPAA
jgi:selenocysteine lyase/cysteine desulfurase